MQLLRKLTETFGPSGCEDKIAEVIINEIKDYVDEVRRDKLGNIIAIKRGKSTKKIMTAAHMDQIGIMVTDIDKNGFIRFTNVGGLNPYNMVSHNIIFENGTVGTISKEMKKDIKELKLDNLYIDIGVESKEEAIRKVNIGDYGVFQSNFTVNGERVSSGALDDRIGCYILINTIKQIKSNASDIYFVFTVQEEGYLSGAATSAYTIEPDAAIVIDVTSTGDTPESIPMAIKLNGGAAVKVMDRGMICHPTIKNMLADVAVKNKIKYQFEILKFGATDGAEIHISKGGVPTGAISIPTRYIHSAQEIIDLRDVRAVEELLKLALEEYK